MEIGELLPDSPPVLPLIHILTLTPPATRATTGLCRRHAGKVELQSAS